MGETFPALIALIRERIATRLLPKLRISAGVVMQHPQNFCDVVVQSAHWQQTRLSINALEFILKAYLSPLANRTTRCTIVGAKRRNKHAQARKASSCCSRTGNRRGRSVACHATNDNHRAGPWRESSWLKKNPDGQDFDTGRRTHRRSDRLSRPGDRLRFHDPPFQWIP